MTPETGEDIMRRLERALMEHDRKVDLAVVNIASHGARMCECSERIEHSIERLGDTLVTIAKKNGNGVDVTSGTGKWLDMAMRVILTLVGLLALITLGPVSAAKLLGH